MVGGFRFSRHFTVAEAEALLPTVRGWLAELAREAAEVRRLRGMVQESGPDPRLEEAIEERKAWMAALIGRFEEEGIELKGLEPALVDFPALMQGVEVYLCWREPEERVGHWHPLSTGYAGRRPIAEEGVPMFEWCN